MSIDVFLLEYFQKTLEEIILTVDNSYEVRIAGVVGNEYQFVITAKNFPGTDEVVNILINSSVQFDTGISASSGQNSIRGWLVDNEGKPLGSKTQRWVTRQLGWEDRLKLMIEKLVKMAISLNYCQRCGSVEKVFIVKKEGQNKGRHFVKCACDGSFQWLDSTDDGEIKIREEVPSCPKCGAGMRKRDGKFGEFWGCSQFPSCKGTRRIGDEKSTPADREDRRYSMNKLIEGAQDSVEVKRFVPSHFQQAIFDWVDDGYGDEWLNGTKRNLVVEALAGSGKTTTGVEMLKRIPRDKKVLFVAFNRHIAKELQKRAPVHVKATTLHSLGFAACRKALKLSFDDVRSDKVMILLKNYMDVKANGHLISPIKKLVSLVKANLVASDDLTLENLASFYGIELNGDADIVFQAVAHIIEKSMEYTNMIDFDDMCWLPVVMNLPCESYDFIFVDEAQDLNKVQLRLVQAHINEDTRFVAVGDRYQSLYGFRGANVDSMQTIITEMNADVLPLSITYRNPKCVVDMVNEEFSDIPLVASEMAIDGEIRYDGYNIALASMNSGDMVLCRVNAPLVKPCFELIRRGVKAVIRGRDIGKGLLALIHKMKAMDIHALVYMLTEYREMEVAKLLVAKKNSAAQSLQDKVNTIIALADGVEFISELEEKIESVFSDDVEGVVFSSVHRAKGLESDNVFILEPGLMPHPMAIKEWELQQEDNVRYVALTRTKETLVFVS